METTSLFLLLVAFFASLIHVIADDRQAFVTYGGKDHKIAFGTTNSSYFHGSSDVDKIIAVGKQVWDLIKENKPVVDYKNDWAGAVPSEYKDAWLNMQGWQTRESEEFRFHWTIMYITVSEIKWKFNWKWNGSGEDEKGQYIVDAGSVLISSFATVDETISSWVETRGPYNFGSISDPVAGIDVQVFFRSTSSFADSVISCVMTLKGDGGSTLGACAQHS